MRTTYLPTTLRSRRMYWGSVFLLLLTASLLGLYAFLFSPDWLQTAGLMPIALHSPLRADYSADLRGMRPISLSLGLIGDAARDQAAQENDPLPELIALLQTPVPTSASLTAAPATAQPAALATITPTVREDTPPPASSPTLSWTPTLTFSVTPSITNTPPRATATRNPTSTKEVLTPTPLPTKVPPSTTPVTPTSTRTPLPTPTNPPPTGYPPPDTPEPTGYPFP